MLQRLCPLLIGIALIDSSGPSARAQAKSPRESSQDFYAYAMRLREAALSAIEPRIFIPTNARTSSATSVVYQWKQDIITTTFWCGENAAPPRNPVHNHSSSWDVHWAVNFGGYDDPNPNARLRAGMEFRPRAFVPKLNPFYFALPYNDVTRGGTKPEARTCIPWFRTAFVREGRTVLRDRWIAIRNRVNGRIAYAQWSDCGPFRTDHWQYVFGTARPTSNLNGGAGLDVSPSVRDYLGMAPTDTTDWRFVEVQEVPPGPWQRYGENNPFVQRARSQMVKNEPPRKDAATTPEPRVSLR